MRNSAWLVSALRSSTVRSRTRTGRFTKRQILERVTAAGLRNRRNQPLSSRAFGMLLRNQLYAGIIDVPEYGVRDKRGDFEALISAGDASQTSNRSRISESVQMPKPARQRIG